MGRYLSESRSNFSESISQENHYPQLEFSDQTYFDQENPSGYFKKHDSKPKNTTQRKHNQAFLEKHVKSSDEDELFRAKTSTNEDLDELKGCFPESIPQENQHPPLETSFDQETPSGVSKKDESWAKNTTKRKKNQVFLEGYVGSSSDEDKLVRAKSLTDEDLDELKGCLDLGFGFSYDEIPELCNTLPALELCYSMSQKFLDEQQKSPEMPSPAVNETASPPPGPIANWKISSPGDHPEDVKARLKYWAQAVACTVRLCN